MEASSKHKVMPSTLMCARLPYLKPQADSCSQRQATQPAGWPFSKHPAACSLLHLINVNGLQGTPGVVPDGSHNWSSGHLSLRCEAVEGCDGCGSHLDRRMEFAICGSFSRHSATVSGATGRNGRSCPVYQSLKYLHRGTYRVMVLSASASH